MNGVRDIKRMAGHQSYGSATGIYGMLGVMVRNGIKDVQQSYDRLKAQFEGQGGRTLVPPLED